MDQSNYSRYLFRGPNLFLQILQINQMIFQIKEYYIPVYIPGRSHVQTAVFCSL